MVVVSAFLVNGEGERLWVKDMWYLWTYKYCRIEAFLLLNAPQRSNLRLNLSTD